MIQSDAMNSPKGVSPLIASVLLIAFTMAIAAILTAWISSFTTSQKEKTQVFEEKINCNYGFIENDVDFTAYNGTDPVNNGIFKTRVKNTGTIDLSIGKYQVWYNNIAVPTIWTITNPTNYSIKKQDARIITLNVSGPDVITKIKLMGYICDGVTTTVTQPLAGWGALSTYSPSDVIAATKS
ncbi:Uncharacterised protein [uncultured archaeon]|nr:Uncharacterised protein [uncultured archaeon]